MTKSQITKKQIWDDAGDEEEPWKADLRSGCCAIYPKDKTDGGKDERY